MGARFLLQISVYVQKLGSWPKNELPPYIFPQDKGTPVGEVVISDLGERGDEMYNITYDYEGKAGFCGMAIRAV